MTLPDELWRLCLRHLDAVDCANAECVCSAMYLDKNDWIKAVGREANKYMVLPFNVFILRDRREAKMYALYFSSYIQREVKVKDVMMIINAFHAIAIGNTWGLKLAMTLDPQLLICTFCGSPYFNYICKKPPYLILEDDLGLCETIRVCCNEISELCWFGTNTDPVEICGFLHLLQKPKEGGSNALDHGIDQVLRELDPW